MVLKSRQIKAVRNDILTLMEDLDRDPRFDFTAYDEAKYEMRTESLTFKSKVSSFTVAI